MFVFQTKTHVNWFCLENQIWDRRRRASHAILMWIWCLVVRIFYEFCLENQIWDLRLSAFQAIIILNFVLGRVHLLCFVWKANSRIFVCTLRKPFSSDSALGRMHLLCVLFGKPSLGSSTSGFVVGTSLGLGEKPQQFMLRCIEILDVG